MSGAQGLSVPILCQMGPRSLKSTQPGPPPPTEGPGGQDKEGAVCGCRLQGSSLGRALGSRGGRGGDPSWAQGPTTVFPARPPPRTQRWRLLSGVGRRPVLCVILGRRVPLTEHEGQRANISTPLLHAGNASCSVHTAFLIFCSRFWVGNRPWNSVPGWASSLRAASPRCPRQRTS